VISGAEEISKEEMFTKSNIPVLDFFLTPFPLPHELFLLSLSTDSFLPQVYLSQFSTSNQPSCNLVSCAKTLFTPKNALHPDK
jgi:hypothetical protein